MFPARSGVRYSSYMKAVAGTAHGLPVLRWHGIGLPMLVFSLWSLEDTEIPWKLMHNVLI